ncbi:uncharacterized protein Tco025E_07274, partial [Trypanosoma conorhini]
QEEERAAAAEAAEAERQRQRQRQEEAKAQSKARKSEESQASKSEEKESKKRHGEASEEKAPKPEDEERRRRHEEKRRREKELAEREEVLAPNESSTPIPNAGRSDQHRTSNAPTTVTTPAAASAVATPFAAGKAPPRTKPTHEVLEGPQLTAAPIPGVIRESKRTAGVKAQELEDEDDWKRVAEQQEAKPVTSGSGSGGGAGEAEARGYLGQQALKAKREQEEEAARRAQDMNARVLQGGGGGGGIIIHTSKSGKSGAAVAESELSKLREQLQLLTKASNPLGKLLESIYDDIDTMARELEMWRSEARSQALAAADARRQTMESLQEVHAQLQNLEDAIKDQVLKTHNIRRSVINNDNAIAGMVRMILGPDTGKG